MSGPRYLCIHGHFYQPPRENPWLEEIELQDSAFPYHDWNDRITAECYEPNTAARILDGDGRIVRLVNNYERMSFNVGPTLLKWMEDRTPEVYQSILDADAASRERFGGHGSAIAQPFNHMILPLASERDLRTQVRWGIRDFEHRFGRAAEGMWLPETAVDVATLEAVAAEGVRYTILEPHQAARTRGPGLGAWTEADGASIDPTRPYRVTLPSGRSIAVFFYDGPISRAVAFERLLTRGELFADRLLGAYDDRRGHAQLAHIATDGETYGHHHRHGEMALAYAMNYIESGGLATLTNYGQFLEMYPPEAEAEIVEDTSWSCAHGIERWRSDCGCNAGSGHQRWRAPLREALDWLREETAGRYEATAGEHFSDPWAARDDYIDVILDRDEESLARFFGKHARSTADPDTRLRMLKLLELQRHAMLMYTSCGWFFNDISGIETVQVIQYAGRVVQLAGELFGVNLEPEFIRRLGKAESNLRSLPDGGAIYRAYVQPSIVGLRDVAAHYAVSSLFAEYEEDARIFCYRAEKLHRQVETSGNARMLMGRARLTSVVTTESMELSYAILHLGDHNVSGGVRPYMGAEAFAEMSTSILREFERADYPAIIRLQDQYFEGATYSLRSLFRDEQRHALSHILDNTIRSVERTYRDIYIDHQGLMQSLRQFDYPLPTALRRAAEVVLHADLGEELRRPLPDFRQVRELVKEGAEAGIAADGSQLQLAIETALSRLAARLEAEPEAPGLLENVLAATEVPDALEMDLDSWQLQKAYYVLGHNSHYAGIRSRAESGEATAQQWVEQFRQLGDRLRVVLPD